MRVKKKVSEIGVVHFVCFFVLRFEGNRISWHVVSLELFVVRFSISYVLTLTNYRHFLCV